MSSSEEEVRPIAGVPSPATNAQDRVRLTIHCLAEHRSSGSDDHLSSEGRGTPHDTTEGLDQEHSTRSDHLLHRHTTLGQSYRVSEPKGGIDVPDKASSPGSVGEEATPAGMLSAELPASSPPTEALTDPKGSGLTVAAIRPAAVNSRRDASIAQQHQSTEIERTSDEALGVREPAQNLGVSPPPSPLLAAAGQPPTPVPLPQSGAPGARNYLDIIRSPAPTRPSSPAPPSALPPVELPSLQSAVSRDPPFGVVAEAAAAGRPDNHTHAFPSPGNGACRAGSRAGSGSEFSAPVEPPVGTPPDASLASPFTDDVAAGAADAAAATSLFALDGIAADGLQAAARTSSPTSARPSVPSGPPAGTPPDASLASPIADTAAAEATTATAVVPVSAIDFLSSCLSFTWIFSDMISGSREHLQSIIDEVASLPGHQAQLDTPALRGVNNTGGPTRCMFDGL